MVKVHQTSILPDFLHSRLGVVLAFCFISRSLLAD